MGIPSFVRVLKKEGMRAGRKAILLEACQDVTPCAAIMNNQTTDLKVPHPWTRVLKRFGERLRTVLTTFLPTPDIVIDISSQREFHPA